MQYIYEPEVKHSRLSPVILGSLYQGWDYLWTQTQIQQELPFCTLWPLPVIVKLA